MEAKESRPEVALERFQLPNTERLPDEVVTFIHQCDTVFLGTTYEAPPEDRLLHPSHVGLNHRGGRPGFVRVLPSNGRTIVIPDFSGQLVMYIVLYL